jgi:hypothetical protein
MLASREEGEESLRSTTLSNGDPLVRASAAERPIIEKTNQERLFQESAEAKRHARKASQRILYSPLQVLLLLQGQRQKSTSKGAPLYDA